MSIDSIEMFMGARIRRARFNRGITPSNLAQALQISQSRLADYEDGQRRVELPMLLALSRVLNVEIRFFFTDPAIEEELQRAVR